MSSVNPDTRSRELREAADRAIAGGLKRPLVVGLTGDTSDDWTIILPRIFPPPKGRGYLVMDPGDYFLLAHTRDEPYPGTEIIVNGDVDIAKAGIRKLPRALVRGNAKIRDCPKLEEMSLICTGNLRVEKCPQLGSIAGEVYGNADFVACGMAALGAGFWVGERLRLKGCEKLGVLNCEAAELVVEKCGIEKTGGGFSVRRGAKFDDCPHLRVLRGRVGDCVRLGEPEAVGRLDLSGLRMGNGDGGAVPPIKIRRKRGISR